MNEAMPVLSETAAALRREFDRSFASAPITEIARLENMLAVRVGGDAYAIRVAEIGGMYADRRIVPLPSAMPSLLGMTGFRGQLAPVYDLAVLLGYPPRTAARWLVLVRGRHSVALAFDTFEAQLVVPPERVVALSAAGNEPASRPHVRGAVAQGDGSVRPVLDLPSVLGDIQQRVEATHLSMKER